MSSAWRTRKQRDAGWLLGSVALLAVHCAPAEAVVTPRGAVAVTAAEGGAAEGASREAQPSIGRSRDATEPARDLLDFLGIGRGERIADLGAGAGYSIQRMAEAVGPSGVVYTRHDPRPLSAAAKPGAKTEHEGALPENIVVMATPDSAPFSAAARDLDLVTLLFSYSDITTRRHDRLAFNRAVFAALGPERFYIIAGHGATPGVTTAGEGSVDEERVRLDVEAAGFIFVEGAQLLPSSAPSSAASNQYLLKFRRPQ